MDNNANLYSPFAMPSPPAERQAMAFGIWVRTAIGCAGLAILGIELLAAEPGHAGTGTVLLILGAAIAAYAARRARALLDTFDDRGAGTPSPVTRDAPAHALLARPT